MRLLLDTAVFLFVLQAPERLSKRAAALLSDSSNDLELSSVSVAELAIKGAAGKLHLELADVSNKIDDLSIRVLPYSANHAFLLFDLPLLHRDPFDRQIIAQALVEHIPSCYSGQGFPSVPWA